MSKKIFVWLLTTILLAAAVENSSRRFLAPSGS